MPQTLELLAPARDVETARIAILAGADAVYIGAPAFGARAAAGNTVEDIATLVSFAHQYRVKIYVTMNTILFDNELEEACSLVWKLYSAGVDALIVQDMAYLEMDLPPIEIHASTQCDIRSVSKSRWLEQAGFAQLVLPRELSLDQISEIRSAVDVPLEVFVHGALCVSYSGDCHAGSVAMSRSANRGVCPQMCRLPYDLVDETGRKLMPRRHFLSLRDMCRLERIKDLIDCGVSSFKIEGRLKDARYVANIVALYSAELNRIVSESGGKFRRSSIGKTYVDFEPNVDKTFNRGYTQYFLDGRPEDKCRMASILTPKWVGVEVGEVEQCSDSRGAFTIKIHPGITLANGDGMGFFDKSGTFIGFRLNRVSGNTLFPASVVSGLTNGTKIYRNSDKQFNDKIESSKLRRVVSVDFTLNNIDDKCFALTACDARGAEATIVVASEYISAQKPQQEQRIKILSKLGDTIYELGSVEDNLDDRFVAASVMTQARRDVLQLLQVNADARYQYSRRRPDNLPKDAFAQYPPLTYHDNISNHLARRFYLSHGAKITENAVEVLPKKRNEEVTVMTTRYCLRRELGACLLGKDAKKLPSPIFLSNESGIYRIDFECQRCGMKVIKVPALPKA